VHESGDKMTEDQIVRSVIRHTLDHKTRMVVLTGGEPLLQVTPSLLFELKSRGCLIHIETNGNLSLSPELYGVLQYLEVVVSPKTPKVDEELLRVSNTLKVLYPFPGGITFSDLKRMKKILGIDRPQLGRPDDLNFILQPTTPRGGLYTKEGPNLYGTTCRQTMAALRRLNEKHYVWRMIPQTHVMMGVR